MTDVLEGGTNLIDFCDNRIDFLQVFLGFIPYKTLEDTVYRFDHIILCIENQRFWIKPNFATANLTPAAWRKKVKMMPRTKMLTL